MICPDCRGVPLPAQPPVTGIVLVNHTACRGGTWCDCQHQQRRPPAWQWPS